MWRIVWEYDQSLVGGPQNRGLDAAESSVDLASVFDDVSLIGGVEPVFSAPAAEIRESVSALEVDEDKEVIGDLSRFRHAFVRDAEEAEKLRERLVSIEGVGNVEIEGRPTTRFRSRVSTEPTAAVDNAGFTPDLTDKQVYLQSNPGCLDVAAAWRMLGGEGQAINVIDIEWGWNFDHEDLQQNSLNVVAGPSRKTDHGTAVLGVIGADANPVRVGVVGIAPGASTGGVSPAQSNGRWNIEEAVRIAAASLNPGNVILLELQTSDMFPSERVPSVFTALQLAVAKGIYVIEVAGNAGRDLDGAGIPRQRDSGAILVGSGGSAIGPTPLVRRRFSNFGSRLDVQGWGENVATCGGRSAPEFFDLHNDPDPSRCYTRSFRETSSAASMVAGVVACIAGMVRAAGIPPLPPKFMRDLLIQTGQPQRSAPGFPDTQNIGPLPNLGSIVSKLLQLGMPLRVRTGN